MTNSSAKIALISTTNGHQDWCEDRSFELIWLREKLFSGHTAFYFPKNHFLFEALEEVLQLSIPFGIPQHNHEKFDKPFEIEISATNNEPKILTIEDLSFGYVLWLIACAVSISGFLIEILLWLISKLFKKEKEIKFAKIYPTENDEEVDEHQVDENFYENFKPWKKIKDVELFPRSVDSASGNETADDFQIKTENFFPNQKKAKTDVVLHGLEEIFNEVLESDNENIERARNDQESWQDDLTEIFH